MSMSIAPDALPERRNVPRRLLTAVRILLGLAVVALGIAFLLTERSARWVEAQLGAWSVDTVFAKDALASMSSGNPAVVFLAGGDWLAMRITIECSIALYAGSIVIFGGLLLMLPRLRTVRVVVATAIGVALMILLNQVRIVGLAWVFAEHGREGFEWAHSLGGSFLMTAGLVVSLGVFLAIVPRRRKRKRFRQTKHNQAQTTKGA